VRKAALLLAALLLVAGCGEGGGDEGAEEPSAPEAGPQVVIATDDGEVTVPVEVADSDAERERGLMNRESLGEDAGMIFLFQEDSTGGFWMRNTLIPLSIAYVGANGQILRILDMEPCRADPCPVYEPGVAYRSALEVNEGAFGEWGVEEGDRLSLRG
jgi:uncharacterized membrane protein (UPF0127 family)